MARKIGVKKVEGNISGKWPPLQGQPLKLSLHQRLNLYLFKATLVGFKPFGDSGQMPEYLVKCPTHGLYYASPQGYSKKLECAECLQEKLKLIGLI